MRTSSKKNQLAIILRRLADYVEHCSDDELTPLFEEASRLVRTTPPQKKNRSSTDTKLAEDDLRQIANQLRDLPSREDGEALLREKIANKVSLEALARMLQLPVQREDTVERLRAKIVETSIGFRLRSDAIQGRPLKG